MAANSITSLVGKKLTKEVKFMGQTVTISKLTVSQSSELQELAESSTSFERNVALARKKVDTLVAANEDSSSAELALETLEDSRDSKAGLSIIRNIIEASVEGATDISDEDFETFPLDELNKLSEAIMAFSNMGATKKK